MGNESVLETAEVDMSAIKVVEKLSEGGSGGNLPKWLLEDSVGYLYAKGRSNENTFEPEAEVCAYKLAHIFGVPAIKYELMDLSRLFGLPKTPVCVSRDYTCGYKVMSLYRYAEIVGEINPASIDGQVKFDLINAVLNPKDKELHITILYFDYLVGNKDRHLRNFEVHLNADGTLVGLVPMFDTGACLFSDETEKQIEMAIGQSDNYVHSKPYADPHSSQLKLLTSMGCLSPLRKANKEQVYKTINGCFPAERAKLLGKYVTLNMERLELLCRK